MFSRSKPHDVVQVQQQMLILFKIDYLLYTQYPIN